MSLKTIGAIRFLENMPKKQQKKLPFWKKAAITGTIVAGALLGGLVGKAYSYQFPGKCAKYARIKAESKFKKYYNPTDAWNFAKKNLLKKRKKSGFSVSEIKKIASPGDVLGIWFKDSKYNKEGRLYTHLGLVVKTKPKLVIWHNFYGERELKEEELKERIKKGVFKVIDIISSPYSKQTPLGTSPASPKLNEQLEEKTRVPKFPEKRIPQKKTGYPLMPDTRERVHRRKERGERLIPPKKLKNI